MRSHCQLCVSSTVAAVAVAVELVAFVGLVILELDASAGLGFAGPVSAAISAESTAGELVVSLGLAFAELVSAVVSAERTAVAPIAPIGLDFAELVFPVASAVLAFVSVWLVSAWPPSTARTVLALAALDPAGPIAYRWHHLSQPSSIFSLGYRMNPFVSESRPLGTLGQRNLGLRDRVDSQGGLPLADSDWPPVAESWATRR